MKRLAINFIALAMASAVSIGAAEAQGRFGKPKSVVSVTQTGSGNGATVAQDGAAHAAGISQNGANNADTRAASDE